MRPLNPKRKRNDLSRPFIAVFSAVAVFLSLTTGLVSCGTQPEPVVPVRGKVSEKKPIKETQKKTPDKEKEIKKERPQYTYNPQGKRDPFRPFIMGTLRGKKEEPVKGRTPLETYNLSQLKLVGIVWGGDRSMNMAMMEDPLSNGYVLKRGTRVGKNQGRVVSILNDRIVIRERYRDFFGRMTSRKTSLKLHVEEEGEIR